MQSQDGEQWQSSDDDLRWPDIATSVLILRFLLSMLLPVFVFILDVYIHILASVGFAEARPTDVQTSSLVLLSIMLIILVP